MVSADEAITNPVGAREEHLVGRSPRKPPMEYEEILELRRTLEGKNVTLSYNEPVCMDRAEGTSMYDVRGNRYLDCVNNVAHCGHSHRKVVEAQISQLRKVNTNSRYLSEVHSRYVAALTHRCPEPLRAVFLVNSGSEANDLALQICWAARPQARHIAVLDGAYHGHTSSMMDVSPYKFWGPNGKGKPAHVHVLPLPDMYRQKWLSGKQAARKVIGRVRSEGFRLAAFFCESVLSCAGQVFLPDGWLKEVFHEMREHGAICIADEVQCGFGRLGNVFWAFETHGVIPDIVVCGKAMGNGYPIAGVVTSQDLARAFTEGPAYFNTFGGSTGACASALAVLQAIDEDQMQANAADVGAYMIQKLQEIKEKFPDTIGDVRGHGLFIGVEIVSSKEGKKPCPARAMWMKEHMKRNYVLMSTDGIWMNVLKIKPPLVFSREDADQMLTALERACAQLQHCIKDVHESSDGVIQSTAVGRAAADRYFGEL